MTRWMPGASSQPANPKLRQNQFGGTVGGPVYIPKIYNGKDRTFFFSNYEGIRIRQEQFGRFTLPTDEQRAGNLSRTSAGAPFTGTPFSTRQRASRFPGTSSRQAGLPPNRKRSCPYFPRVNRPGQVFNYEVLAPVITNSDSTIHRLDHRFTPERHVLCPGRLRQSLPSRSRVLSGLRPRHRPEGI